MEPRGPDYLDSMPEDKPRMIKSHLHYRFLPTELRQGKGKIIYILRNPKASVPSLYRFYKYLKTITTDTLREYSEKFFTGKNAHACPWGAHISEYWEHRNDENVLFLQFEQTIQDRSGTVLKIADFLGVNLTDEQVNEVVEHTTLESMKNNKSVNLNYMESNFNIDKSYGGFINKGEISGWRKDLPDDLAEQFDEMIEREIGHTGITFPE